MLPNERDALIVEYFAEGLALLQAKGHDYAGEDDSLANLRRFGLLGIIVRLSDKIRRLENLVKADNLPAVADENLIDTLRDIANYAFLARIFAEAKDK